MTLAPVAVVVESMLVAFLLVLCSYCWRRWRRWQGLVLGTLAALVVLAGWYGTLVALVVRMVLLYCDRGAGGFCGAGNEYK